MNSIRKEKYFAVFLNLLTSRNPEELEQKGRKIVVNTYRNMPHNQRQIWIPENQPATFAVLHSHWIGTPFTRPMIYDLFRQEDMQRAFFSSLSSSYSKEKKRREERNGQQCTLSLNGILTVDFTRDSTVNPSCPLFQPQFPTMPTIPSKIASVIKNEAITAS